MRPDALLLLRHAEEPDAEAGIGGVDERGQADDASLSVRGWQRAGALALWLARGFPPHAASPPAHIRFAPCTRAHPSHRPAQTVLPLARACGRAAEPLPDDDDPRPAAQALLACSGLVVCCGRHQALPALARALAEALQSTGHGIPERWPEDCFDAAWWFAPTGEQAWSFNIMSPHLLDGGMGRSG